ncbi:MAG: hypothetical protein HY709_09630 [Candidatus Latescibacteria bacterium]|nr:hypothetical protein [Candidatus Latescibacterota bacterium]
MFVEGVVGKSVFLAIGNHDERVSTASCCRFYLDLLEANIRLGMGIQAIDFYCTSDIGHSLGEEWYQRGAEFLLRVLSAGEHG